MCIILIGKSIKKAKIGKIRHIKPVILAAEFAFLNIEIAKFTPNGGENSVFYPDFSVIYPESIDNKKICAIKWILRLFLPFFGTPWKTGMKRIARNVRFVLAF